MKDAVQWDSLCWAGSGPWALCLALLYYRLLAVIIIIIINANNPKSSW